MNQSAPSFPDTKPFNHDIARTLFAPFFFSLYHYKGGDDDDINDDDDGRRRSPSSSSSSAMRHRYRRPSPFEDPDSARTAERMLRRMMENRIRSDGRTVCPDARTFGLVAGAFGRLRCGSPSDDDGGGGGRWRPASNSGRDHPTMMVEWEEEPRTDSPCRQHDDPPVEDDEEVVGGRRSPVVGKIRVTPVDKLQELLQLQLRLCRGEGWPAEIMPSADAYDRVLRRLARRRRGGSFGTTRTVCAAELALLWLQFMESPMPSRNNDDNDGEGDRGRVCEPSAMTHAHVIGALASYRAPVTSESNRATPGSLEGAQAVLAYEEIGSFAEELGIEMTESARPPANPSHECFLTEAEGLLAVLEDEHHRVRSRGDNIGERGWREDETKRALARGYRSLLEGWGRYAVAGVSDNPGGSTSNNVGDIRSDFSSPPRRQHAIDRSHELLRRLEALANENTDEQAGSARLPVSPTANVPSSCYSSVILALSISDLPSAATVAEGVLRRMLSRYSIDEPSKFRHQELPHSLFNAKDVSTAFSGCIAAHAKNNDAPKAEEILNQMIDLHDAGLLGSEFVPEVRAFGTCIALWSKYSRANVRTDREKGRKPSNKRGKRKLPSHRQRLQNADRAEAILSQLERVAEIEATKDNGGFVLHATPYNIAILARVQTVAGNSGKYSRDDREDSEQAIRHAESILDHMEYEMGVTPDPYTYSILLNAWCQQSRPGNEKSADYAEELLRRRIEDVDISKIYGEDDTPRKKSQHEIWPNVKHYSSVLKAHAKTKSAGGAKKALSLLSEMERRFYDANTLDDADSNAAITDYHVEQKDVAKPDIICYSIVIDAFANSRLPEASDVAHRLLRAVETKYSGGDVSMKPNTRIYTAVILSLVHSPLLIGDEELESHNGNKVNNAQRAWSILERMKKNDVLPNSFTYNYIINCAAQACRDADDQRISFEVALRAFQELRKSSTIEPDADGCVVDPCHPDSFTFAFMLKACKNLLPSGELRTKVMSQTFRECCRLGYLNDAVLDRLWHGVSSDQFYELIEGNYPDYHGPGKKSVHQNKSPIHSSDLPMSWSKCCNSSTRRSERRVDRNELSPKKGKYMANR